MPISTRTHHRIWYDTAGDAGPPVLLIMGYTMRGIAWRYQIEEFAQHHRVAWFDHAGLGRSGPITEPLLFMEHLARDTIGVLDDLGWEEAHVVGLSMGGMIAQHVALSVPSRVRSLTLAATHAGGIRAALPPRRGMKLFLETSRGNRESRIDALSELLFGERFRTENPERVRELLAKDFAQVPERSTRLAQLHAISRHRTVDDLRLLGRHPTLVVQPGEDVLIKPENSEVLARGIPGSKLVRFPESGHAVGRQEAERFNEVILEHIASA